VAGKRESPKDSKLKTRFGPYADLLDGGYTPVLNDLLSHLVELNLSPLEFTTIVVVLSFKKSIHWPFPSTKVIAQCIGVSEISIKRVVASLSAKGFLERKPTGKGRAKIWDFSGLYERLRAFLPEKPVVSVSSVIPSTKEPVVSVSFESSYSIKSDPSVVSVSSVIPEPVEPEERTITTTTGEPRSLSMEPEAGFPQQDFVVVVRDISQDIKQLQQLLDSRPYDPHQDDSEGAYLKLLLRLLELTLAPGGREEVEGWIKEHGEARVTEVAGVCKRKVQEGAIAPEQAYTFLVKALKEKVFLFITEVSELTKAKREEVTQWVSEYGETRVSEVLEVCKGKQEAGEIKSSCYGFVRKALEEGWSFDRIST